MLQNDYVVVFATVATWKQMALFCDFGVKVVLPHHENNKQGSDKDEVFFVCDVSFDFFDQIQARKDGRTDGRKG